MRPRWQVERALTLSRAGRNDCEISRELGVSRRTVNDWVRGRTRIRQASCFRQSDWREFAPGVTNHAYAYLLGLYLGDGMLSRHPRDVYRLRVFLDRAHPVIVAECSAAISIVLPNSKVGVYSHKRERVEEVYAFSRQLVHLFPQHGPGPKHLRGIALEPWQNQVVEHRPGRFLRGLIHSDGCRVENRVRHPKKTYVYPRYFFSNRSRDIQRIFCETCNRLGIAWRQDGPWNISIARREAVAIMDRHVGPKR